MSIHVLRLVLLSLFFCCVHCAAALALSVDQVRIGTHPGKARIVIELSQPTDYKVFLLSDPKRIVVDLPEFQWRAGKISNSSLGIVGARHGVVEPGLARIVLDLNRPVVIQSSFLLPGNDGRSPRLVIDYAAANAQQFENALNQSFGSGLQPRNDTNIPAISAATSANGIPVPPQKPETAANPALNTPPSSGPKPLVVIDPGHGGQDPGAIGPGGIKEKNITLALGRALKQKLEDSGQYRVMMTRDKDVFIKLRDRVGFARKNKADLFISLHADSIDKAGVQGASIYTLSEKASDKETQKLADRENRADLIMGIDVDTDDQEVASILVDLTMRDTVNQSRYFASRLSSIFKAEKIRLLERPTRSAGFAVLKAPDVPSILVEAGFMSNKREAEMLNTPEHRDRISRALKNGIDVYFEQVRKNQRI